MRSLRLLTVSAAIAAAVAGCGTLRRGGHVVLEGPPLEVTDPAGARFAAGKRLLDGFDAYRPDGTWAPGDSILLGIAMDAPGMSREWYLRATALRKDLLRVDVGGQIIVFSDSVRVRYRGKERGGKGDWVRVDYDLVPVNVELFDGEGKPLSASLAMMPEICLRHGMIDNIELEREGRGFYDSLGAAPADGSDVVAGEEQKRFLAGWLAMMKLPDFLHRDTMQGVLWQLMERPSLISIALSGGVSVGLSMDPKRAALVDPPAWGGAGLPGPVYRVPMGVEVNGFKAMECELLLARAIPPLGPANGLLAVEAVNPRDARKRVTVRLLAARTIEIKSRPVPPSTPPDGHPAIRPAAASPAGSGP